MAHAHGARREDGQIGAALALHLELRAFQAVANLVVADFQRGLGRIEDRVFQRRDLLLAPVGKFFWRCGVVAMAIDDPAALRVTGVGNQMWVTGEAEKNRR
jgi:hypothetical protein